MIFPSFLTVSPAKINLFLKVISKRSDNYHNLCSLVQKITLFDVIKIVIAKDKDIVKFSDSSIDPINNTVYKALQLFKNYTNINKYFTIKIIKNIPIEAGLGGGSSNAAVVLKVLNKLCKTNIEYDNLIRLGAEIGADVPLFISDKNLLIFEGIGDVLKNTSFNLPNVWILIVKPDFSVSTKWVYKNLNFELTNQNKSINRAHLQISDFVNDLEKIVMKKYPVIKRMKLELKENGSLLSLMSGSGSAVYGIFNSKEKLFKALSYFKNKYRNFRYYCCRNLK